MKDSVQQNSRSSPKTMVLNQGLLSEAESFFLKGKSIQILIFKMVMVILNFNILRHGPWQMHLWTGTGTGDRICLECPRAEATYGKKLLDYLRM